MSSITIDTIDRATCRGLRAATETALQAVAAAHGLTVTVGPGSFEPTAYRPKIEYTTATAPSSWARYAPMYNLPLSGHGTRVVLRGFTYTLTGINPKSRRFPITATRADGKTYKLPLDLVRQALDPR